MWAGLNDLLGFVRYNELSNEQGNEQMSYGRVLTNDGERRLAKLNELAKANGYRVQFEGTKCVRGWPQASTKPYQLRSDDGTFLCSFATMGALETNLRGRAGC